jgi:hypothetical protein
MKNWTTQAEQRLSEYLRERTAREGLMGDDAAELKEDLRSHIHEEAEHSEHETIGLMHLEQILGKLDAGYRPAPQGLPVKRANGFRRFLKGLFGVALPLGVLVFEMISSFCGSTFFDPVPTIWHALLVALVPLVNGWQMLEGRGGDGLRGVASGIALVTALFYGLLFLPIIHLSIIALIFLGMGLLSLTPVLTAIATWRIGRDTRNEAGDGRKYQTGWRIGVAAGIAAFCLLEAAPLWTRANLTSAMAGGRNSGAVDRLRAFHSERVLLKACYEGNRGTSMATDISGWIWTGWRIPAAMIGESSNGLHDSEKTRDVFFRVTGKPYNSLKPPKGSRGGMLRGWDTTAGVDFDDHLGGDSVAVRLRGLDLAESRFDGHLDSVSRLGYGEWTMVFKNDAARPQEARCQVRLPRDGRVSRLTLWVNGEPREAAFSTVSKVKAAYKAVAVVQQRDPVLVNVVGPDTVMVQCFPVPAHGSMKIRLGVTAPLDEGHWELPRIVERNFGTTDSLEHAVWLQGDNGFSLTDSAGKHSAARDGAGYSLNSAAPADAVEKGAAACVDKLPLEPAVVWCEDRFAKPEERFLIREPVTVKQPAADKIVVVIDGSASMNAVKKRLADAIGEASDEGLTLILADDGARRVGLSEIRSHRFTGGRDNEPALREAIRLARETGAPVLWIHGPQAVGLAQSEAIQQALERGTLHPVIYEVEAVPGPNRLAEAIYRSGCLRRGPAWMEPEKNLARFLKELRMEQTKPAWNWKRAAHCDGLAGSKVWDQLARFWAVTAVEDSSLVMTDAARAELAALYQTVTPFSGAVVLETQAQYTEHGLTPADGDATPKIPSVPEPSSSLLIILAAAASLLRRKREISSNFKSIRSD